jgi:hypothetical protein
VILISLQDGSLSVAGEFLPTNQSANLVSEARTCGGSGERCWFTKSMFVSSSACAQVVMVRACHSPLLHWLASCLQISAH